MTNTQRSKDTLLSKDHLGSSLVAIGPSPFSDKANLKHHKMIGAIIFLLLGTGGAITRNAIYTAIDYFAE